MRPTVLLIPGTLCDERVFSRIKPRIGIYASLKIVKLNSFSGQSDWVSGLLTDLPERTLIVGFSLGGMIALEILRRAPDRVSGLALISSNAEPASRTHRMKRQRLSDRMHRFGLRSTCKSLKGSYFLSARNAARHKGVVMKMALRTQPARALKQFNLAGHRASGHPSLESFGRPVYLVAGQQDHLCPPPLQKRAAKSAPVSTLTLLPRCGHFAPLERPGLVSRALIEWINDVNSEVDHVHD